MNNQMTDLLCSTIINYYAIMSASNIMHLREVPAAARLISPECK